MTGLLNPKSTTLATQARFAVACSAVGGWQNGLSLGLGLLLALGISAAPAAQKIRVQDPQRARELIDQGGRLVADYGSFQVIELGATAIGTSVAKSLDDRDSSVIRLNSGRLAPSSLPADTSQKPAETFLGRRLQLIQFAGPVKPEWRSALESAGAHVVSYIPNNSYLLSLDATALEQIRGWAAAQGVVEWTGEYVSDYKIHPEAKLTDAYGFLRTPVTDLFAVQLLADEQGNASTLSLIEKFQIEPPQRDFQVLGFRNVIVRLPAERLPELAAKLDVVSIQPYGAPQKQDERQAQILAGNLSGVTPSAPGYLAWLTSKGFTAAQFATSGFLVDISDSGIDNGTAAPGHFGLYEQGDPAQPSRIVYNRLVGAPHVGSLLAGTDGHGNLNAHILAGFNNFGGGFPHADAGGFRYGLGICPFVKLGSSVIFDPVQFTSPNYSSLQSEAYQSGARISANSWGFTNNTYTVDAQAYDALVRDAQPAGSAFAQPGNQEMVIVFAAGNRGPTANSIGAPGTAKNVITVGASENVRSLTSGNGGSSSMGSDGCGFSDAYADSAADLANFSSRGPCSDGRQKPDLVAPGSHITGGVPQSSTATNGNGSALAGFQASSLCALNGSGSPGSTNNFFPLGQQFYTVSSGTSHATPAVAGAAALVRQYFINNNQPPPSPAMTKAFLMNSTRYLTGAGANDNLWSPGQGMGELNLGRAFDGIARMLRDEASSDLFTASGQTRVFTGRIADTNQPLRVTVAWTDAPGNTGGSAFNNDLDLTLQVGTNTYVGNVFSGAYSVTGGTPDARNNVESIFLPAGTSGDITVTITAANINSDGVPNYGGNLDQDFALVVYNATETAVPVIVPATASVSAESFFPTNGCLDSGETVQLGVALRNIGTRPASNLVVTLLATNGVLPLSPPQTYGLVSNSGIPSTQSFAFTATAVCGSSINAMFHLQDGADDFGVISFSLPIGLTTVQTKSFTNSASITIPDSGKASPYPAAITVTGLTGVVTKVTATIYGYSHSWPDDVDVLLVGPQGQKVMLLSDCGGGAVLNGVSLTFDDKAAASAPDNAAILSGAYKPTNFDTSSDNFPTPAPTGPFATTLATFNSWSPNGTWALYVQDDGSLDSGSITQGWSLSITTSNLSCATGTGNSADLRTGQAVLTTNDVVGSNVTVAVTIANFGPDPAGFVSLTNLLPTQLTFLSAISSQGPLRHDGNLVIADFGTLAAGASATLTIETVAAAIGTFTNQAWAGALTPDPVPINNASWLMLMATNLEVDIRTQFVGGGVITNTAPILQELSNRAVHAGSLVQFVAAAVDADVPTNLLSFYLDAGAPAAATLNAGSGLFSWQTTDADANSTNLISLRVLDNGTPQLSAARSFVVTVAPRPLITGIIVSNRCAYVSWTSLAGQGYRLQACTNLQTANWQQVLPEVVATGSTATMTNAFDPNVSQFFRVQLAP